MPGTPHILAACVEMIDQTIDAAPFVIFVSATECKGCFIAATCHLIQSLNQRRGAGANHEA
jgi:hypothetical protein